MVTVTTANIRAIEATWNGLDQLWEVTFAIDGQASHCELKFTVITLDALAADHLARGNLRRFLQESERAI